MSNDTDLQIYEMYFVDGMKETEIAESMGLDILAVHEILARLEETVQDNEDEEEV